VLFEQWQLEPERTALRDEAQSLAEEVAAAWVDTPRHILGTPDGELLVEILEARHAAEPQSGFDKMAAQWRARIAPRQDSTQLGTPSLEPSERAPPRSSP
jgi:hypothetical protein